MASARRPASRPPRRRPAPSACCSEGERAGQPPLVAQRPRERLRLAQDAQRPRMRAQRDQRAPRSKRRSTASRRDSSVAGRWPSASRARSSRSTASGQLSRASARSAGLAAVVHRARPTASPVKAWWARRSVCSASRPRVEPLDGLHDARVERAPALVEQARVRHVVRQGVAEGVDRVGKERRPRQAARRRAARRAPRARARRAGPRWPRAGAPARPRP